MMSNQSGGTTGSLDPEMQLTLKLSQADMRDMCALLEDIADSLPHNLKPADCAKAAESLQPLIKRIHAFEESEVFPRYAAMNPGALTDDMPTSCATSIVLTNVMPKNCVTRCSVSHPLQTRYRPIRLAICSEVFSNRCGVIRLSRKGSSDPRLEIFSEAGPALQPCKIVNHHMPVVLDGDDIFFAQLCNLATDGFDGQSKKIGDICTSQGQVKHQRLSGVDISRICMGCNEPQEARQPFRMRSCAPMSPSTGVPHPTHSAPAPEAVFQFRGLFYHPVESRFRESADRKFGCGLGINRAFGLERAPDQISAN